MKKYSQLFFIFSLVCQRVVLILFLTVSTYVHLWILLPMIAVDIVILIPVFLFLFRFRVLVLVRKLLLSTVKWSLQVQETLLLVVLELVEVQLQLLLHLFTQLFHVVICGGRLGIMSLRLLPRGELFPLRWGLATIRQNGLCGLSLIEMDFQERLFAYFLFWVFNLGFLVSSWG